MLVLWWESSFEGLDKLGPVFNTLEAEQTVFHDIHRHQADGDFNSAIRIFLTRGMLLDQAVQEEDASFRIPYQPHGSAIFQFLNGELTEV